MLRDVNHSKLAKMSLSDLSMTDSDPENPKGLCIMAQLADLTRESAEHNLNIAAFENENEMIRNEDNDLRLEVGE